MNGHILIVDLEGTCCDDESIPLDELETIEIGAVVVSDCKIAREFQTFVRPVRHPILTEFCKNLTSIRQEDVDSAPTFPLAFANFRLWWPWIKVFYSWGRYDLEQFHRDWKYHGDPFPLEHVNLARVCKKHFGTLSKWRVTKRLGIEFEGTVHRGIDDARHYGKIVAKMMEMGIVIGA